ncbi:MarR family winged helix-turn-helix transcriptional regulator [Xanthobacter sediminis]
MSSPCHCATLRLATRRLSAAYDRALEPLGLNIAQYGLLRRVSYQEAVSLTTLGQAQGLDRSTMGRNARVLERRGLLSTARSDDDQREVEVRLTEPGRALLEKALPIWEGCQRDLEEKLGADRLRHLREILAEI